MSKKITFLLIFGVSLLAIAIFMLSISYQGGAKFNWFDGFKKNSITALGTWSFIIVGVGLSVAGFAMQSLTRNELASAYSLGSIAGAALSLVLVKYIIAPKSWIVELVLSFIIMFAISSITLVLTLSDKIDSYKIIIIGLTISVLISSVSYVLRFIKGINSEMIGFLALSTMHYTWRVFWITMPIIAISTIFLITKARDLQVYSALPEKYLNLGIKKYRIKLYIALPTILISLSAVLLVGPISFVGIVIPHITRAFFKRTSVLTKMIMNIPISIIILLMANIIWRATFSYHTNINAILGIIAAPLIIIWVLKSKDG